tara:strand:+ start:120 stop:731 length:612 start_codon:yes stop_codon:yes gene_type:complete
MSGHFFNSIKLLLFILILFSFTTSTISDEKNKKSLNVKELKKNFPAAVIDMQKVLSKSTAMATLQKEVKKLEDNFKEQIKSEEDVLKKEQENLKAQKSVLAENEFKTKEQAFKVKVNKVQSKVQNIRRELESTMARGMQIIQAEAVKHLKEIASKEGYLVVFDASTTVITADVVNISDLVTDKVNKSLPKINIERNKEREGDN